MTNRKQTSRVGRGRPAVYRPNHPHANAAGYIPAARAVMEDNLGRMLKDDEVVCHKDGDQENLDPGNLEVMTHREHTRKLIQKTANKGKTHLDYDAIAELVAQGVGANTIADRLGYKLSSTKSAVRIIKYGRKEGR